MSTHNIRSHGEIRKILIRKSLLSVAMFTRWIIIKALTALVGRLSHSVGWEDGPERVLKLFHLTLPLTLVMLNKLRCHAHL